MLSSQQETQHAMVTVYITYAGDADTRFDRDHWIDVHLPLVREAWGPHGLISTAGFFPSGRGAGGLIAICPCVFRDEAALQAALACPETERDGRREARDGRSADA